MAFANKIPCFARTLSDLDSTIPSVTWERQWWLSSTLPLTIISEPGGTVKSVSRRILNMELLWLSGWHLTLYLPIFKLPFLTSSAQLCSYMKS